MFQLYIDKHRKRYLELIDNNERICGEWMVKTHSLKYALPHEPFVAFDIMKKMERVSYDELVNRTKKLEIITPGLIHRGDSFDVKML